MTAPKLAVQQPDGSRMYVHPLTGETVPSVTTVIAMVAKPFLVPWAAKMAAQHAVANWTRLSTLPHGDRIDEIRAAHEVYSQKAADTGDIVHGLAEAWVTGQPFPSDGVEGYATQFVDFLMTMRPRFIENEATVWSRNFGYAGTLDFIAEINGEVTWVDIKSGKSLHDEIGLQLAALAGADFIIREDGTEDAIPPAGGLAGLHIRPRGWKLVPVLRREECFDAFLAARELLRWQAETAPYVLRAA